MSIRAWRRVTGTSALVWLIITFVMPFTPWADNRTYTNWVSNLAMFVALGAWWAGNRAEDSSDDAKTIAREVIKQLRKEGIV